MLLCTFLSAVNVKFKKLVMGQWVEGVICLGEMIDYR